jgi:hypothetical protein
MATGVNPTKIAGSNRFLLQLQIQLAGYAKEDPPTKKKLPVEADVPELLIDMAYTNKEDTFAQATADLRIGEYTIKSTAEIGKPNTKQTVQFKLEDVTFFSKDRKGRIRQLPRNASEREMMTADSATLKLDNQKNGWKAACIHQEVNGEHIKCPVRALARRVIHLRQNKADGKTFLCKVYAKGGDRYVCAGDVSAGLKVAASILQYPLTRGIPISSVDTHSLRSGGANALALSGYSDTQIQKMGRWRGKMFKDYIREDLACYSAGMSTNMKQNFKFVNIAGNVYNDVTDECVEREYEGAGAPAA